ncbi:MAG: hypothetical protein K2O45_16070 [Oscillospiraceae bacterium]|nr:hypothetical protein [Oscillospiraceae bacterium]
MAMRVTTGMAMSLYRYNLGNSTVKFNSSMNKVMTHRKFDSFAEDPTSAVQAWRVRRAMVDNNSYRNNNSDVTSRFNVAFAAMNTVTYDLVNKAAKKADIWAESDPTGGARVQLGQTLTNTADSVIQTMNSAKYSDHFVFSGTDEMNPPFLWDGETLYYRGVNVNAGGVKNPAEQPVPSWALDDAGNEIPADGTTMPDGMPTKSDDLYEQAWIDYYKDPTNAIKPTLSPNDQGMAWGEADEFGVPEAVKNVTDQDTAYNRMWAEYYNDQGDLARLEKMSKEEQNVDLGMGLMKDENGNLVKGSAFNRALPAINMLGYGVDENGDPNNVVLVMKRLGEIFSSCDYETGDFPSGEMEEEANRLMDKLKKCNDDCISVEAEISTKAEYLQANDERMKLQAAYLEEDRYNLEEIDPADAISTLMYDYYCYNAALKVGTQLLSQSLIDYMN